MNIDINLVIYVLQTIKLSKLSFILISQELFSHCFLSRDALNKAAMSQPVLKDLCIYVAQDCTGLSVVTLVTLICLTFII